MSYAKINDASILAAPFNRLNDAYFKFVLASPERKHLTIAFLNAVLKHYVPEGEEARDIEDVEFLDREVVAHVEELKGARFDVFARAKDGRVFHIEVQNVKEDYFMKRSFYYAASDYMTQLERGASYETLRPVIFIGLMNFTLFGSLTKPEEWYTLHRLLNVKTHEYTLREVEFHMVEMPLLRRYLKGSSMELKDEFEELLCYFGRIGGDELMAEIAEHNPVVKELLGAEERFQFDAIAIRNYLINERARIDWEHQLERERRRAREEASAEAEKRGEKRGEKIGEKRGEKRGEKIGEKRGIEIGREEGRMETLRTLRAQSGLPDEKIAEMFNVPISLIKSL